MITISLCMIVKNEEDALEKCLSSVKGIADEIVIVDTGSTDRTKEIAAQFTDRIFDFKWIDDFSAARNYSFSQATQTYIFWLDADDHIQEKDRQVLLKLKQTLNPDVDSVTLNYYLAFDESGNVTSSLRRNRIVRRDRNFQWIGPVHEYLAVWGHIEHSEAGVTHGKNKVYTDRNLQIYVKREKAGELFSPRDQYYFANELRDHAQFNKAVLYYELFLKGKQGWIEDNIQACLRMADCYGKLGNKDKQVESMCLTLTYDKPRPEFCCAIGNHFFEEKKFETAIYWFKTATEAGQDTTNMALVNQIHSTWYPHLQLCLCYDRLGRFELANEHNEKALAYRPAHPSMLYNRTYFQKLLAEHADKQQG
ncbi:glycosyltransferase family 2 protein [Paenibacillus filicis]|uniref:Glycosyltransferase family 2 protein n=1 Tax=Paenibacillus filicis TaxID=669464 RepID=A0ABU9DJ98_9BACL